jgi:ribosomal protein L11 methyltransferase
VQTVVIRSAAGLAELAADDLRSRGAAAVEERSGDREGVVEVVAVLGEPGPALDAAVADLSLTWDVRLETVDAEPADTWKAFASPVPVGDWLVIRPEWVPAGPGPDSLTGSRRIDVAIDPGGSFGLGDHPTTRLCAAALGRALRAGDRVLDMGCGSGVLAVVAVRLGASRVVAVDISPEAVSATRHNAALNGVSDRIDARLGSEVPEGTHDLVVANILAPVLIELCAPLAAAVVPGGRIVLSGLLEEHHDHVVDAYAAAGLELVGREALEGWCALEFRRADVPST